MALAANLATGDGITPWPTGGAVKAAAATFRPWQRLRGIATGGLERQQVVEKLRAFIDRQGDARFSDAEDHDAIVRDRAGWWRSTDGDRPHLFTSDGMREALLGFDFNRALAVLQEMGAIEKPGADGTPRRLGASEPLHALDPWRLG